MLTNENLQTDRQTYIQTDTFAKTIFSGSEGLKTWTFDKNGGRGGGTFCININNINNCINYMIGFASLQIKT